MNQFHSKFPESNLGIEYEKYLTDPYLQIIASGENEWLANAAETYGPDAGEVWATDILPRLLNGNLQPEDFEDIQLFTPIMFEELCKQPASTDKQLLAPPFRSEVRD